MKYKFIGKPDKMFPKLINGKLYTVVFENENSTRPKILKPVVCPYSGWLKFYENWSPVGIKEFGKIKMKPQHKDGDVMEYGKALSNRLEPQVEKQQEELRRVKKIKIEPLDLLVKDWGKTCSSDDFLASLLAEKIQKKVNEIIKFINKE